MKLDFFFFKKNDFERSQTSMGPMMTKDATVKMTHKLTGILKGNVGLVIKELGMIRLPSLLLFEIQVVMEYKRATKGLPCLSKQMK